MLIAKIENNKIIDIADYRQFFPEMGLTPNLEQIKLAGYLEILNNKSYNFRTHKLVTVEPYILDNYVHTVDVVPKDEIDLQRDTAQKATEMRLERNRRLKESDWTQISDSTADKQAWLEYRQILRNITNQPGFPWDISWPKPPGYISYEELVRTTPLS